MDSSLLTLDIIILYRINLQSKKVTKKTIRHHIIASAAHDGEPGVIAKSQKPAPSIKLSKEMHPVVVLVASGSTLYSFITIAIYMLCVQK